MGNAMYVGRPTKWGNLFTIEEYGSPLLAIAAFNTWLLTSRDGKTLLAQIDELRGKDLACWCPLWYNDGERVPCHADVLLELANENYQTPTKKKDLHRL